MDTTTKDPREKRQDPRPEDKSKQPVREPEKRSPNQQDPPTDNERTGGNEKNEKNEKDEKIRRSNQAGDQDVDEPVDTEEGKSGPDGTA
jgi:hypothetical protein